MLRKHIFNRKVVCDLNLGGGSVVVDLLFIVTPIVGVCNCSMFRCTLFYVPSSFAINLMGKRESWLLCLVCLPGVS